MSPLSARFGDQDSLPAETRRTGLLLRISAFIDHHLTDPALDPGAIAAHHQLGQHRQAVDCFHRSLELYRDLGDRFHESTTLTHLGDTHHAAGDASTARAAWQHALAILDDLNHPDAAQVRAKLDSLT